MFVFEKCMWDKEIQSFGNYLKIERGLSNHSLEAYLHDIRKLATYLSQAGFVELSLATVDESHWRAFLTD